MLPYAINALNRLERIADINFAANTSAQLPTQSGNLPTDRFIHSLAFEFEGRMTNPAAGAGGQIPTAVLADAPFSIIERISIEGYHRVRARTEKFIDIRGADLRRLVGIYYSASQAVTPATLVLTADATNDIRFRVDLPFVPLKMPARMQAGWLLDAPNYDSLKLNVQFGDSKSVFVEGSLPVAFSAFGSASGVPRLRVSARYAMAAAAKFSGFLPGRVWRYSQDNQSADLTATGVNTRLFNVPRGNMIRSILLKTGVKATTASAGNVPYLTLSESILANLRLYRGINRIIRDANSMRDLNNDVTMGYGPAPIPAGYSLLDFCLNGEDQEIFDLRSAVAGPTGDVDTYIQADVTGASNQIVTAVYEEWRHRPMNVVDTAR